MNQKQTQELCLKLLHADTETAVIEILKRVGFWDNPDFWRLYGDKEGNFAQAGNQQALPEAALVEKIVNCCDARLMAECLKRGIDPESAEAPKNIRDAVAMFFENRRALQSRAHWPTDNKTSRTKFCCRPFGTLSSRASTRSKNAETCEGTWRRDRSVNCSKVASPAVFDPNDLRRAAHALISRTS